MQLRERPAGHNLNCVPADRNGDVCLLIVPATHCRSCQHSLWPASICSAKNSVQSCELDTIYKHYKHNKNPIQANKLRDWGLKGHQSLPGFSLALSLLGNIACLKKKKKKEKEKILLFSDGNVCRSEGNNFSCHSHCRISCFQVFLLAS